MTEQPQSPSRKGASQSGMTWEVGPGAVRPTQVLSAPEGWWPLWTACPVHQAPVCGYSPHPGPGDIDSDTNKAAG